MESHSKSYGKPIECPVCKCHAEVKHGEGPEDLLEITSAEGRLRHRYGFPQGIKGPHTLDGCICDCVPLGTGSTVRKIYVNVGPQLRWG